MRVLIVGCGYIGLPLGIELARHGHDVFGLRRSAAARGELEAAGIRPITADITIPGVLAGLPGSFDWVVNCVASGGGTVEDYRRVYLQGMRNLLEWLKAAPPQKLVYTSSTSVYGQSDGTVVREDSPVEPLVETARVLAETEKVLLDAARQSQFPGVILRVAGIYGPDRGQWMRQYLRNEARIDGKGERILNMIHRDDVIGCIIAALERGRPGEVYNAVDDEPVSQLDFYAWLAHTLGRELPLVSAEAAADRKRGATNKKVSNKKLKTGLGYEFKYADFRLGCGAELQRLSPSGERSPAPTGG